MAADGLALDPPATRQHRRRADDNPQQGPDVRAEQPEADRAPEQPHLQEEEPGEVAAREGCGHVLQEEEPRVLDEVVAAVLLETVTGTNGVIPPPELAPTRWYTTALGS